MFRFFDVGFHLSLHSADEFHSKALRTYLARFDFTHDPLDVALRKLLMNVGLPRETQQIDRVMEAFAMQYRTCHPNLFISEGASYIDSERDNLFKARA